MPGHRLAERTGFEPAEAVNLARFPSVCLKPLDHLSKYGANLVCSNIIPKLAKIVNTISANFKTFCGCLRQITPHFKQKKEHLQIASALCHETI